VICDEMEAPQAFDARCSAALPKEIPESYERS